MLANIKLIFSIYIVQVFAQSIYDKSS
jgi:hypothetical protein